MSKKILFIDRDGTLIDEPEDKQIDSLEKFKLKKHVIPALISLQKAGYKLIMVSNQDGLGTHAFPTADFEPPQHMLLEIFNSQGIYFDDILICPHFAKDACACRKPQLGLVLSYLREGFDLTHSYVIGDRESDLSFAKNLGIEGILYTDAFGWLQISEAILNKPRIAKLCRKTNETNINVTIDLDHPGNICVSTGLGFFDHMLEQLAKHGGFSLNLTTQGDLYIDEHHTVEDTALALGEALRLALSDKLGIERYGFLLPMDEACTEVAIDLSGRSYFIFNGAFTREKVGDVPTELIPHFFHSLASSLGATLHIKTEGENNHHMVESMFKGVGRALRQAIKKQGFELPTTKGVL